MRIHLIYKTIFDLCFGRHGVLLNSKLNHIYLRSGYYEVYCSISLHVHLNISQLLYNECQNVETLDEAYYFKQGLTFDKKKFIYSITIHVPVHNVLATGKGSDKPALPRSLLDTHKDAIR